MRILRRRREHIALETLSEHLDGRLRGAKRERVERHLEACSLCSEELRSLEATVGLLRRVPMDPPRRVFTLGEAPSSASAWRRVRVPAWAYGAVASVAVMLFVALLSADLRGSLAREVSTPETEQAGLEAASVPHEEVLASPAAGRRDIAVSATPGEPQEGQGAAIATEAAVEGDSGVEEALPMSTSAPQIAAAAAPIEEAEASRSATPGGGAEREASKNEVVTRDETTQTPVPVVAAPPAPLPDAPEEIAPVAPADARDGPEAPAPEVRAGGTSVAWHILEGVLGGVAFLLTGGVLWRLWRTRGRVTP